jgi:hypothetical protein
MLKHRSVRKKLWLQPTIRQYYDHLVRKTGGSAISPSAEQTGKRNE